METLANLLGPHPLPSRNGLRGRRRRRHIWHLAAVGLMAAVSLAACGDDGGNSSGTEGFPDTITIGMAAALSGPSVECCGTPYANGAKLAVDEINADGGIDGRKVELEVLDHQGDPAQGALVMQRFVSEDIPVVISNFSGVVGAQAPIAEQAGTLLLNPAGADDNIAKAGDTVYTTRPFGSRQDKALVTYALDQGNLKFAMLVKDVPRGRSALDEWHSILDGTDAQVTSTQVYPPDTANFSTFIAKLKADDPDAILLASEAQDGGLFVKQARDQGVSIPIYATDAISDPAVLEAAGSAAGGVVYSSLGLDVQNPSTPEQQEFVDAYREAFDSEPNIFSALHYDAIKTVLVPVIEQAIKEGKPYSGADLIDVLAEVGTFPGGVTGTGTLTEERDMERPLGIYEVQSDGSVKQVAVEE